MKKNEIIGRIKYALAPLVFMYLIIGFVSVNFLWPFIDWKTETDILDRVILSFVVFSVLVFSNLAYELDNCKK